MSKKKNTNLKAQVQALSNQLNINHKKPPEYKNTKVSLEKSIKKDLLQTLILIVLSFGILFLFKYLDTNFFFNKFF